MVWFWFQIVLFKIFEFCRVERVAVVENFRNFSNIINFMKLSRIIFVVYDIGKSVIFHGFTIKTAPHRCQLFKWFYAKLNYSHLA